MAHPTGGNTAQPRCCTTQPGLGALSPVQGGEPQLLVPGQGTGSQLLLDSELGSHGFPAQGREEGLCPHVGPGALANLTKLGLASW